VQDNRRRQCLVDLLDLHLQVRLSVSTQNRFAFDRHSLANM
jgi:hypothetical protein